MTQVHFEQIPHFVSGWQNCRCLNRVKESGSAAFFYL